MNMYSDYLEINYSYYWHGYVSVLRPLMYFMTYDKLRFFNWVGQFTVVLFLCREVKRKTGRTEYALLLATSYLLLMPLALAMSLQFTWVFYIGSLGCLVLMHKNEWFEKNYRYVYIFVVVGLLTSYFDLLTYPLFTWGVPVLWWLVAGNQDTTGLARIKRVIASGFSWLAGYGLMWVMKWTIGSMILRRNLFESAIDEVFLRSGTSEDMLMNMYVRLDAVYRNWRHYEYSVYFTILAAWLMWVTLKALRRGWHTSRDHYAYLLIGCSSLVWYMVLANHTIEHHFFTYRIFNVSAISFLILLVGSVIPYRDGGATYISGKKGMMITTIGGLLLCVIAGGCSFIAREEIAATNAQCPSELKDLEQGGMLEFTFVPTYSKIRNICICLRAVESNGTLNIIVSQQDEVLYHEDVAISNFEELGFFYVPVEWDLHAGEDYNVQYAVTGSDGLICLAITEPGNEPLQEFKQVVLNGNQIDGQPIVIISYWNRPIIKKRLIFLALSWLGVLMGITATGYTALTEIRCKKFVNS